MYTNVICTLMLYVHLCYMYTYVICTLMLYVHLCYMYRAIIAGNLVSKSKINFHYLPEINNC